MRFENGFYRQHAITTAPSPEQKRANALTAYRSAVQHAIAQGLDAHDIAAITKEAWERYGDDDETMRITITTTV